jgi:hypothetical protein
MGLSLLAFTAIGLAVMAESLSPWALLLPAVLLPIGLQNGRRIPEAVVDTAALKPSIERTLAIHAAGCLWLAVSIWL